MDIQLSDGSCFDILRRMEIRTPVIFTTAYDQYAPWTMWTASFDGLHAAGWIGLAAGLRF